MTDGVPMITCRVCGRPADVHMTEIRDGVKTTTSYCIDHAADGGLPESAVQKMRASTTAIDSFHAFVRQHRRVPTDDELRALGVIGAWLDPSMPDHAEQLERIRTVAEMIIADPDDDEDQPT